MAVYFPIPNSRPLPASRPIDQILNELTRTPSEILGEPPLPPLPPRKPPKSSLSYQDAIAITNAYPDPVSILGEPPLPEKLPPRKPKKRNRPDSSPDTNTKRRKKEDKLPSLTIKVPRSVLPPKPNANQSLRPAASLNSSKPQPAALNDAPPLPQHAPTVAKTEAILSRPGRGKLSDSASSAPIPKIRSSPHPAHESKNTRKDDIRTKSKSSQQKQTDSVKASRKIKEQPALRSSPSRASSVNDTSRDKIHKTNKSTALTSSAAQETRKEKSLSGIKLRSSPVRPPDVKDAPKEKSATRNKTGGVRNKSRTAAAPPSDAVKTDPKKSPKKPPLPLPPPRSVPRVPRSQPAPSKSTSPEPTKKLTSSVKTARRASTSKADSGSRSNKTVVRDRREEKKSSRRRDDSPEPRPGRFSKRRDDSPEVRRRADRAPARRHRESSADGKRRDTERRRPKDDDDHLSDEDMRHSTTRDKGRSPDSDREHGRGSDRSSEKRPIKGRNSDRRRRDSESKYDRDSESSPNSKKGGEKRKREADRTHESERVPKVKRKDGRNDGWSSSETPVPSPHDRDNSLSPTNPRLRSVRPEPDETAKDRPQPKSNFPIRSGHSIDVSAPKRTPQPIPLRSVPAPGAPRAPQSISALSRPVREPPAASNARPGGVMFGQEVSAMMSNEERRKSTEELNRLVAEQKDLLSQFDSLTKLSDEYLSRKKHDEFEETVRKALRVYFKLCLKKETQLRMLQRMNQEWTHVRKEVIGRYKYLTKHFGPTRVEQLRRLGRTKTAQFISHQVHKCYLRIFMLQRCWDKEQRSCEAEVRRTANDLHRDGTLSRRELFGRTGWFVKQALDDYANLLPLLDAITADWGDGDHIAGFEMNIPSDC